MNIVVSLKEYITNLNKREFYRLLMIGFGILCVIVAVILYLHFRWLHTIERKLKRINQLRTETRTILEQHETVKFQQQEVDVILEKDPTFKIKEYFTSVTKEFGLEKNMVKPAEVSEPQDLNNGYSEIKLEASFTDLNMKQLTNLLYKIEQTERIFTKELVINKALKSPTIDVTLVIATLQPQQAS